MLNEMLSKSKSRPMSGKSRFLSGKTTKIITILCLSVIVLQAQDITNKLGGNTAAETYDVTDSNDNLLFRVQGDKGALFTGTWPPTGSIPVEGAGTRLMWYPGKAAFRVGYVSGTQWNDTNIGLMSFATGYNTTASGSNSTAMGRGIEASGEYSVAIALNDQNGTNVTQANTTGNYNTVSGFRSLYTNSTGSNNGGAATWTYTGAPAHSGCRIASRIWSVQETGDVGTVRIEFDVADADFDIPARKAGTGYFFVYDTDNDGSLTDEPLVRMFDDGSRGGDQTASDNVWTVNGINLQDGQEFTIVNMIRRRILVVE